MIIRNLSYVAPSATLAGNVEVWDYSSVWYGCVIKADVNLVRIGPSLSSSLPLSHSPFLFRYVLSLFLLFGMEMRFMFAGDFLLVCHSMHQ